MGVEWNWFMIFPMIGFCINRVESSSSGTRGFVSELVNW
jgi:hypothetical protein